MSSRAYMNNTSETLNYKVWSVGLSDVKSNHFPMLKSHNIPARCVMDHESFTAANGGNFRYGVEGRAEFETTNSEQEVILKLLFGSDLLLMSATAIMPYSITRIEI